MSEMSQNPSVLRISSPNKPTKQVKKPSTKRSSPKCNNKNTKTTNKQHQQPHRVVYISNPRRVEASASEFRALVQELTGRDAVVLTDPCEQHHQQHQQQQQQQEVCFSSCSSKSCNSSQEEDVDEEEELALPDLDDVVHLTTRQSSSHEVSCFGSDLMYFGSFDGSCEDHQMVANMEDHFSSFYSNGCL